MAKFVCIVLFFLFSLVESTNGQNGENRLDVAAFNVRMFGLNKMSVEKVPEYLVKIILRYDLILIQEIRDSSGEAIQELMKLLKTQDNRYQMVLSERLGRSTSKEQYAYIYREDWLTPITKFVYNDVNDVFEREPFVVHFRSSLAAVSDFIAIGIHTKPSDAANEISQLVPVYNHAVQKLNIQNAIILGDFNAACTYVSSFDDVALATDHRFYWLIDDSSDTTTSGTNCAYDRIVIAGQELLENVVPGSTGVLRFDAIYQLTESVMEAVSDHFPVQFQIESKYTKENIDNEKDLETKDKKVDATLAGNYRKIYSMKDLANSKGYKVVSEYTSSGAYLNIHVSDVASSGTKAGLLVDKMRKDFPEFISPYQELSALNWLASRLRNLARGHGSYQTLYDYLKTKEHPCSVTLSCSLANRSLPTCSVKVLCQ
jgi:deoxyribonuclease-1-like protein